MDHSSTAEPSEPVLAAQTSDVPPASPDSENPEGTPAAAAAAASPPAVDEPPTATPLEHATAESNAPAEPALAGAASPQADPVVVSREVAVADPPATPALPLEVAPSVPVRPRGAAPSGPAIPTAPHAVALAGSQPHPEEHVTASPRPAPSRIALGSGLAALFVALGFALGRVTAPATTGPAGAPIPGPSPTSADFGAATVTAAPAVSIVTKPPNVPVPPEPQAQPDPKPTQSPRPAIVAPVAAQPGPASAPSRPPKRGGGAPAATAIPTSANPPANPFVKAVQEDIHDEQMRNKSR